MKEKVERARGKSVEAKREEPIFAIGDFTLLHAVYEGGTDVEREYELERRYKPARLLSEEELGAYPSLNIEQAYVRAADTKDELHSFRLRRTWEKEGDEKTLRVAHKRKVPEAEGRNEYQRRFLENDRGSAKARVEFETLWGRPRWEPIFKTRYYIPWKLPNGNVCEIHYDVHHGGALDGFVRIEVEFKSDADALLAQSAQGYQSILPDWVGQDVTDDPHHGSKSLSQYGKPPEE